MQKSLIQSKSRRRMKRLHLSLILLVLFMPLRAQEFDGMTEKGIRAIMAKDFPGLTPDNLVRNDIHRYLKYHSADNNETWLIFLDDKDRCKGTRITYSIGLYDTKVSELNKKYRSEKDGKWSYTMGRELITVEVKRDVWFFTVTHERTHKK